MDKPPTSAAERGPGRTGRFRARINVRTQTSSISVVPAGDDTLSARTEVSIVIPVFNEAPTLDELFHRLESTLAAIPRTAEVILIDDGSTDNTWLYINGLDPRNFDLRCIALSRNFGKEAALTCGLQTASGDAVIILDADCQDPPELIPAMLQAWDRGADVVNMRRRARHGDSWFKRTTAAVYYRLLDRLSDVPIPRNVGDFRLLNRQVLDEVNRLGERNRYMKGILAWPGFAQVTLDYDREARKAGHSGWSLWQLLYLSISGITAFSNKPLKIASWLGISMSLLAFTYATLVFVRTLIYGDPVSGYPSLMIMILFIGGIQLISIGILGEYIGRIFTEVKGRPNYLVRETRTRERTTRPDAIHLAHR